MREIDNNQAIKANPFQQATIFYLARGPIIILVVIASLFVPYLKEICTARITLHLAVVSLGIIWTYHDVSSFTQAAICSGTNFLLDKIVLDDVLRAIYDPIDGLWACYVGTFMGASTMYGLGMNEDQRAELVQASLGLTDKVQANLVLLEPGGCKTLLPIQIQNWLKSSKTEKDEEKPSSITSNRSNTTDSLTSLDGRDLKSGNIGCDIDSLDGNSHDTHTFEKYSENNEQKIFSCHGSKADSVFQCRAGQSREPIVEEEERDCRVALDQADPVAVFFKIIQKMARAKMKAYAEALPRSKIENIGIAATVALGIQLTLGRRSKKSSLIECFCASLAILSFGTNISREALLGDLRKKQTLQIICKDLALSIVKKIKTTSSTNKALTVMLVLVMLCRRKQVKIGNPFQK